MRRHCPNSLVVKHVLGKDESQVRFLLRAPQKQKVFSGKVAVKCLTNTELQNPVKSNKCGVAPRKNIAPLRKKLKWVPKSGFDFCTLS